MEKYTFRTAYEAWWYINQHLPNPDVVLRKTNQRLTIYRELLTDPHLTAALDSREAATLVNDWVIEGGTSPARLLKGVEDWFFNILERKENVGDLSRSEIIENMLEVIYFGYQPVELSWSYQGRLWVPEKMIAKPPEWFIWYLNNMGIPEIRFVSVVDPINGVPPPDDWTLICLRVKPTYDNPYGRGVASRCFWPVAFKKAGTEFWMNFMERFGSPWVKGSAPTGMTQTELDNFKADLQALVQDAVIAVTGERNVELMETGTQRNASAGFREMLDFFDTQVSKTVLGHSLSMDIQDRGSYAASRGAMDVRDDVALRDTNLVTSTFNDVIKLIARRNGYGIIDVPKVKPYRANIVDTERSTRDEALTRSGVRFSKKYFVNSYNLQEDDIDDVVDPKPQSVGPAPQKETSTTPGGLDDAKTKSGGNKK